MLAPSARRTLSTSGRLQLALRVVGLDLRQRPNSAAPSKQKIPC
jgi:hypothetical protein